MKLPVSHQMKHLEAERPRVILQGEAAEFLQQDAALFYALTYVLISSADSFCVSLVSFTVCCREFPHSWFLLAATVLVESTAISSRRESNAGEGKELGQLRLAYIAAARGNLIYKKATSGKAGRCKNRFLTFLSILKVSTRTLRKTCRATGCV